MLWLQTVTRARRTSAQALKRILERIRGEGLLSLWLTVNFVRWQCACVYFPLDGLAKKHVPQLQLPLYCPYLVTCHIRNYTINVMLDCDSFWVSWENIQRNLFRHVHTLKIYYAMVFKTWVVKYCNVVSPTSQELFKIKLYSCTVLAWQSDLIRHVLSDYAVAVGEIFSEIFRDFGCETWSLKLVE
jgi:hypothetical protein